MCIIRCHMSVKLKLGVVFKYPDTCYQAEGQMPTFYKFAWDIFIAHAVLAPIAPILQAITLLLQLLLRAKL